MNGDLERMAEPIGNIAGDMPIRAIEALLGRQLTEEERVYARKMWAANKSVDEIVAAILDEYTPTNKPRRSPP